MGGVAIPPVVARIFSGDSTSPLTREARTWCGARDSAVLKKVGGVTIPPVVARIISGDSTSPFSRGGKDVVLSKG